MAMAVTTRRRDTLSVAVRNTRRAKGLSQRDLADAVGVHKGTISNLERGVVEPESATIERLEEVLGVDLSPERLYREGTVVLAVEEVERRFRELPDAYRVPFVSQVISYVTTWKPPAGLNGDRDVPSLPRAQYERAIRGIPGITPEQVTSALSLFDTTSGP